MHDCELSRRLPDRKGGTKNAKRRLMTTLVLNDAELFLELDRLIRAALDTRRKLLAFGLRGSTQAIGFIARTSAGALTAAAHELADLVRRLGGRPSVDPRRVDLQEAGGVASGQEQDLLRACEAALAEVACEYRDALEWNLPDTTQQILMRQFSLVIANFEHVKALRMRLEQANALEQPEASSKDTPASGH